MKPIAVKPDAEIKEATTLMMNHDYSQLPVMTNDREVKGMISWKSIGIRLTLNRPCSKVRDCMGQAQVLPIEASLFNAITVVADHDAVLVQSNDKSICGIVTAEDFNDQFRRLAEPFLLVGEIENGVRWMLHGKFSTKDLEEVRKPGDEDRSIHGISDLTFGEYIRLIENEKRWKKLNLALDRSEFIAKLNRIRTIRNDVMHFDPDGPEPGDILALQEFARLLKTLREVGAM